MAAYWSFITGALVVAHSLRDAGTSKKLAVLVTPDSISLDAMAELQASFANTTNALDP